VGLNILVMKALVVGFGSIGQRHYDILSRILSADNVTIVSRRDIDVVKSYKTISDVTDINDYSYFVIGSKTIEHYDDLVKINSLVSNKIILVEKPLFESFYHLSDIKNKVFVAYNLRFHPLVLECKELLNSCGRVLSARFYAGQYLPTWRVGTDYRNSYSAKKDEGGGIMLDYSHDIDLVQFLLGKITHFKSVNDKISDLDITSDDYYSMIGITENNVFFSLELDSISKKQRRTIVINSEEQTIEIDLINNILEVTDKNSITYRKQLDTLQRNTTFEKMHTDIINGKYNTPACYEEGLSLAKLFDSSRVNNLLREWK
jgi:predicted dehydrogenase